jgi:chromosomal replication initiation ATPase DnaA
MKTSEILNELVKHKRNNDFKGFKRLFDSLDLVELTDLHDFAISLKNSCENRISKHLK